MAGEFVQKNVNVTEEDVRQLDKMMYMDGYDNYSAFIRGLIRQEWARRVSQPNPATRIEDVIDFDSKG